MLNNNQNYKRLRSPIFHQLLLQLLLIHFGVPNYYCNYYCFILASPLYPTGLQIEARGVKNRFRKPAGIGTARRRPIPPGFGTAFWLPGASKRRLGRPCWAPKCRAKNKTSSIRNLYCFRIRTLVRYLYRLTPDN